MIGGISYFHEFAYDLLAENERITAAAFDAAIRAHKHGKLQKITVMSSSMVFENTDGISDARRRAAALSAAAARPTASRSWRPNISPRAHGSSTSCLTRLRGRSTASASAKSARWRPRHHERQREAGDVARGAGPGAESSQGSGSAAHPGHRQPGAPLHLRRRLGQGHPHLHRASRAPRTTTSICRRRRAPRCWSWPRRSGRRSTATRSHSATSPIRPIEYDVQERSPDVTKAKEILGFEALTTLDAILDEIIPWIEEQIAVGQI